jgi:hypothetical protein
MGPLIKIKLIIDGLGLSMKSEDNEKLNSSCKYLTLAGLFFLFLVLLNIFFTPLASTYEFSIYDVYPWFFWLSIVSVLFIGDLILLLQIFSKETGKSWLYGLFLIILTNTILLTIPIIRGYFVYGWGDVLTNIGFMQEILNTGSINPQNVYPVTHLIGAELSLVSGLSLQNISMFTPAIFSIFFILFCYTVAKTLFENFKEQLIVLIFASLFLLESNHLFFTPNSLSLLTIPIGVYLFLKGNNSQKPEFIFLFLLFSVIIVLFHPLTTVILIVILCVAKLFQILIKKFFNSSITFSINQKIIIMICTFTLWNTFLIVFAKTIDPLINQLVGREETRTEFSSYANIISSEQRTLSFYINYIFESYGQLIIVGILSILCLILTLFWIRSNREKGSFVSVFLSLEFFSIFVISIIMFFFNGRFGFTRIYYFAVLFSILLIPMIIYKIFLESEINTEFNRKFSGLLKGGFYLIILVLICISTINLYDSPFNNKLNNQVTFKEYSGMNQFYKFREVENPIMQNGIYQDRYYDAIFGTFSSRVNVNRDSISIHPLPHFGYQNSYSFEGFSQSETYFIFNNQGRFLYPNLLPESKYKWKFTESDFQRLDSDKNVNQIYKNGELYVYIIK